VSAFAAEAEACPGLEVIPPLTKCATLNRYNGAGMFLSVLRASKTEIQVSRSLHWRETPKAGSVMPIIHHQERKKAQKPQENKSVSKETKPVLNHRRTRNTRPRPAKTATPDAKSFPRGSQTDSKLADESGKTPNIGVSSQGALPVLSIPGGNQTDPILADKNGEDTNADVSPQGALPVISVPGGS
jgi:hypothetical protein